MKLILSSCDFLNENSRKKDVIYIGGSCGAHLLTKNIEHLLPLDNNIYKLKDYDALGVVDFILIPHYASSKYNPRQREELFNRLLKENKYKVFTLTNDESLIITNKIKWYLLKIQNKLNNTRY